ncbi:MAG: beta-lactamase [Herbinix sp.]|nr:beta-lactamase [Herbinix sp.]
MKKILMVMIGIAVAVTGLSNSLTATAEELQKLSSKQCTLIEEYVEREMKESNIPGAAIGIVHGDEIVYTKGFGVADLKDTPVTADTPFYIGSIGKTFTALAIRQLEGEGKLDSKALVTEYIPWFTLADGTGKQITVENLLNHTSGLSNLAGNEAYSYNDKYSIEEAVHTINKRAKTNRSVGATYEYSNLNYVILGLIVEYRSGMSYEDYLQQKIFDPMQMDNSYASKEKAVAVGLATGYRELYGINIPIDCPYPTGQVPAGYQLSSVNDMTKYIVYFLNNGYVDGKSILPNNQLEPTEDSLKPFGGNDNYYGLEWGITNDPAIHDYNRFYGFLGATSNFNSAMLLSQVHRYGIIVLVNQRGNYRKPELMSQIIGNGISDILLHNTIPAPIERTYNWKVFLTPLLVLFIAVISIISCIRYPGRLETPKAWIAIVLMVIINITAPVLLLITVPMFYDASWEYFLNNGIDIGLPTFVLCMVLLLTGVIKVLMILSHSHRHREFPN